MMCFQIDYSFAGFRLVEPAMVRQEVFSLNGRLFRPDRCQFSASESSSQPPGLDPMGSLRYL